MANYNTHGADGEVRVRLLRLTEARKALTVIDCIKETGLPRHHVASVLAGLERDGLLSYDASTEFFRLTNLGAAVRFKKTPANGQPVDLSAEKDRLILQFEGLLGLAEAAVMDDPVLHERFQIASQDGMPNPDLSDVPVYRRPQVIEEAINAWSAATRSGPCEFCGSRTARRSYQPISIMDPEEAPSFTTKHDGRRACGWCDFALSQRTRDEFREMVGNALAGTLGIAVNSEYRYAHLVKFAYEVGYAGTAWGYFDQDRIVEIRLRAYQTVHRTRFVMNENQARQVSIPGITTHPWDIDSLPGKQRKFFASVDDIRRDKDVAAQLDRIRAEKAAEKHNQQRRFAKMSEADARREAQDEAQRREVEQYRKQGLL